MCCTTIRTGGFIDKRTSTGEVQFISQSRNRACKTYIGILYMWIDSHLVSKVPRPDEDKQEIPFTKVLVQFVKVAF